MMNIPRAFMEHKVRLYSKKKGNDEQEVKKHFKTLFGTFSTADKQYTI